MVGLWTAGIFLIGIIKGTSERLIEKHGKASINNSTCFRRLVRIQSGGSNSLHR
jgi:hypothetical protein